MRNKKGQATLEYIAALIITVLFIAMLLSQVDQPIREWWDKLARKIAAPCPTKECVEQIPSTVSPPP